MSPAGQTDGQAGDAWSLSGPAGSLPLVSGDAATVRSFSCWSTHGFSPVFGRAETARTLRYGLPCPGQIPGAEFLGHVGTLCLTRSETAHSVPKGSYPSARSPAAYESPECPLSVLGVDRLSCTHSGGPVLSPLQCGHHSAEDTRASSVCVRARVSTHARAPGDLDVTGGQPPASLCHLSAWSQPRGLQAVTAQRGQHCSGCVRHRVQRGGTWGQGGASWDPEEPPALDRACPLGGRILRSSPGLHESPGG